jgi:hypothetical protein
MMINKHTHETKYIGEKKNIGSRVFLAMNRRRNAKNLAPLCSFSQFHRWC